jgi:hypothetical protein
MSKKKNDQLDRIFKRVKMHESQDESSPVVHHINMKTVLIIGEVPNFPQATGKVGIIKKIFGNGTANPILHIRVPFVEGIDDNPPHRGINVKHSEVRAIGYIEYMLKLFKQKKKPEPEEDYNED